MRSDPTVWLARVVRMRATLTTMHLSCQCTSACAQHQRLGGSAENEYAFVPRTFVLPRDGWLLRYDAMNGGGGGGGGGKKGGGGGSGGGGGGGGSGSSSGSGQYIVKPTAASRGRGIFLTEDPLSVLEGLADGDRVLVQEYIHRPLLLRRRKFDLRIYVLVTSFSPLRAYVYSQGLARFASAPYTSAVGDGVSGHLTNFSLNRENADYEARAKLAHTAVAGGRPYRPYAACAVLSP